MTEWGARLGAVVIASLATAAVGAEALAQAPDVEIHGFASQGFILTTDNNYLAESERGSFEFSEVGVNLTAPLTDRLRTGVQLFARDLGPIGDYRATVDWFYLDYRWRDWLGLRAGRVKIPFGLYNDISDVDAARPVVLLPQSLYRAANRDFLLAQTGVELYGYREIGDAGALDYRLYGGTIFVDIENQPGSPAQVARLTIPYVAGGRLMWETPVEGLRAGGSIQALRLETDLLLPMNPMLLSVDVPAVLWVGSVEYIRRNWLLAAEYSRWHTDIESSDPMLVPEESAVSERAYAMAAYQLNPWFQASAYYSLLYPDVDDRSGREAQQHDVSVTARFDINLHWLVKLEAHYMHGTADLSQSLNQEPLEDLAADWGVLLAKTTVYF